MASSVKEMNHADCIERDLKEWKKIFSLTEKSYGYRINSYKGSQKLVYIPDMIEGKKVAYIHDDAFPKGCSVICNKRLFEKFRWSSVQANSAVSYLSDPSVFPDEYQKVIKSYITRNIDFVTMELLESGNPGAFENFWLIAKIKTDADLIRKYLSYDRIGIQIKAYLLDLINSFKEEKSACPDTENALTDSELRISDIKKLWIYKKADDGTVVLTGYKGKGGDVTVPEKVGKDPVTALGDRAISSSRPRATPEQQRNASRIASITIPSGIVKLGAELFYSDLNLENVYLPSTVTEIGTDAFRTYRGPQSITIHAPAGSYAEEYAKKNSIPFEAE